MNYKNTRPDIIATGKASSHPLQAGRFYSCSVLSVDASGRIYIRISDLGVERFGPVLPVGTTKRNRLKKNDLVTLTFTDEFFNKVIVFGPENIKQDVFTGTEKFNSLVDQMQSQINTLRAQVQLGNINLQSFKQTD